MKEKILKFKEKVSKTYPLKSRQIDNLNLSSTSRHTLKMSREFRETSSFNLFPQIPEVHLEKNGLKSIFQNPGEVLRQFSRVKENELSSHTDVFKISR